MTDSPSRRDVFGIAAAIVFPPCVSAASLSSPVSVRSSPTKIEIDTEHVLASLTSGAGGIEQEYFARAGQTWVRLVGALRPATPRPNETAPLYSDVGVADDKRLLVASFLRQMRVS